MTEDERSVSFDEAREQGESQQRRVNAYLAKCRVLGKVAVPEVTEINRIADEYAERLGDQTDPWLQFKDHQRQLLAAAMERRGTDEGARAYSAFLANEAYPRPVAEAETT